METIAQVTEFMQTLLHDITENVGAQIHYTKRPDQAKFTASTLVQTLVWGWLAHPDATMEQLAQMAARIGVSVSPQAIHERLTKNPATATLLRTVLTRSITLAVASDPVAIPLLQRFTAIVLNDSTSITLPDELADHARGCGGSSDKNTAAALKCGLQIDLLHGTITHLDLADGRASDRRLPMATAWLPAGSLRLADLGFLDFDVLHAYDAMGVFWLSKVTMTTKISRADEAPQSLLSFVHSLGSVAEWDGEVFIGATQQVRARVLVQAVPQEVADQRRRRLRKEARDHGRTPSAEALALASWTILITNVPPEMLTLQEALVVARVRWQIELIFKLWKSHNQIDAWRSKEAGWILCEVYAKLLAVIIQQWLFIVSCWAYPDRSLVKAAQVVRDHATDLASARGRTERIAEVIETIQTVLQRLGRMNSRAKHPNTYQLLLDLTINDSDLKSESTAA